ncbi:hypothetical protein ccbrp13_13290 [Ktedonobacteria bacterium brp13]|nr:hypothetical protein ccbrp13_13290 [Ktedonobacteria bacterium brp13]
MRSQTSWNSAVQSSSAEGNEDVSCCFIEGFLPDFLFSSYSTILTTVVLDGLIGGKVLTEDLMSADV